MPDLIRHPANYEARFSWRIAQFRYQLFKQLFLNRRISNLECRMSKGHLRNSAVPCSIFDIQYFYAVTNSSPKHPTVSSVGKDQPPSFGEGKRFFGQHLNLELWTYEPLNPEPCHIIQFESCQVTISKNLCSHPYNLLLILMETDILFKNVNREWPSWNSRFWFPD